MRTLLLAQAALAVSLAVGGCATAQSGVSDSSDVPETAVARGDTARVALGEAVAMDGVTVRFVRVAEDSRCPPGVTCVWAGRAHVELVIGGETRVLSVPGYGPDDLPPEATVGGLTVRVARLAERSEGSAEPVWVELVAERA